jgi:hypothetical protein
LYQLITIPDNTLPVKLTTHMLLTLLVYMLPCGPKSCGEIQSTYVVYCIGTFFFYIFYYCVHKNNNKNKVNVIMYRTCIYVSIFVFIFCGRCIPGCLRKGTTAYILCIASAPRYELPSVPVLYTCIYHTPMLMYRVRILHA